MCSAGRVSSLVWLLLFLACEQACSCGGSNQLPRLASAQPVPGLLPPAPPPRSRIPPLGQVRGHWGAQRPPPHLSWWATRPRLDSGLPSPPYPRAAALAPLPRSRIPPLSQVRGHWGTQRPPLHLSWWPPSPSPRLNASRPSPSAPGPRPRASSQPLSTVTAPLGHVISFNQSPPSRGRRAAARDSAP